MSASYDPRVMAGGLGGELARLEAQVAVSWAQERRLLEELGLGAARTVLEVGCGPGAVLARLREAAPAARVVGVDHDPALLAVARERVPDADLRAGDALALPLEDGEVDLVVLRLVLQHVGDPRAALVEARRVLRPGGRICVLEVDGGLWGVVTPEVPGMAAIHAKAWRAQAQRGGDRDIGRRLPRLLRDAGLIEVAVRPYAYHSDDLGLDAFAHVLDPEQLAPRLADGTITPAEYAHVVRGHAAFRRDPEAFVMLLGLLATAVKEVF